MGHIISRVVQTPFELDSVVSKKTYSFSAVRGL